MLWQKCTREGYLKYVIENKERRSVLEKLLGEENTGTKFLKINLITVQMATKLAKALCWEEFWGQI
jgi:hypothetical protein